MKRIYHDHIFEYLDKKIILLSGPRQSGKTTLSKTYVGSIEYLSYDDQEHRAIYRSKTWDRSKDLLIFDELHKMPKWKQWLKGIYDVEGPRPRLLVTGSAKLDTFRKVGDSLAGRFFQYRIHPLDVREVSLVFPDEDRSKCLQRILNFGGFPEPYLNNSAKFYGLWKKSHLDIILRQDIPAYEDIRDIRSLETLIELLKGKVGSPISYSSLAEDLHISDKTVKKWLQILEDMYVVFKITPHHRNIARSNLKQPKYYFYDVGQVDPSNPGARLENLVACSLLKECQFREDTLGERWDLKFLSKRGGFELDFALVKNGKLYAVIEVKNSDDTPAKGFSIFQSDLGSVLRVQLVLGLKREKTYPGGLEVRDLSNWLCDWS